MDIMFSANMIKNEVEIILKELKLKHISEVEENWGGASVIIAFTNDKKRDIAYETLKIRYDKQKIFGVFIDVIKKANYLIRINLY